MVNKMKRKLVIKQNKVVSSPDKKSKQVVEKAILKVENFLPRKIDFEIVFLETREEMDKIYSEVFGAESKTSDWVVGGILKDNIVYIFGEDVYSKVSCHPQENFFPTLVHEITHIFTKELFDFHLPMWLNEGVAYVIAEQDKQRLKTKQDITKAFTEQEWTQMNPYLTAGKFTRFLSEKYGKDKLFNLMKSLEFSAKKEEFEKKFKEIFGKDFNIIWNEWYVKNSTKLT